jgi:ATP-dependent Lhr-like helicase
VQSRVTAKATDTEWATRLAHQWLTRYGLVTRDVAAFEEVPGGFSGLYDVFKAMEVGGKVRRGYFVSGVAALQFAQPRVLEVLRSLRHPPEVPEVVALAASDPANPYGTLLKWPGKGAMRQAGSSVVLIDGQARAWLGRGGKVALVWLPDDEPARAQVARLVAQAVLALHEQSVRGGEGAFLNEINQQAASKSPVAAFFRALGYRDAGEGLQLQRALRRWQPTIASAAKAPEEADELDDEDLDEPRG